MLDDDALAAFYAIPSEDRVTLPQALAQMAGIFDPPSNVRHKFAVRMQGETGTPLSFRSVLLSLAQAAYPKMDQAALDSLALFNLKRPGGGGCMHQILRDGGSTRRHGAPPQVYALVNGDRRWENDGGRQGG
ncbi:unnamed protein product [Lampetra fluviatilis]